MKKLNFSDKLIKAFAFLYLLSVLVTGSTQAQEIAKKIKLTDDVAWVRASAEYRLCVQQIYSFAAERLRELACNEMPGTWCVILDVDETLLSNVEYKVKVEAREELFNNETWEKWCKEEDASALPGAVEFCRLVKELGGMVVLITNREYPLRLPTMKNLDNVGFKYDIILLKEGSYKNDNKKVQRRFDVETGKIQGYPEYKNIPPLKILMLAGDQVTDLYDPEKCTTDDAMNGAAGDLIIIPNPMYGNWQELPACFVDSKF